MALARWLLRGVLRGLLVLSALLVLAAAFSPSAPRFLGSPVYLGSSGSVGLRELSTTRPISPTRQPRTTLLSNVACQLDKVEEKAVQRSVPRLCPGLAHAISPL